MTPNALNDAAFLKAPIPDNAEALAAAHDLDWQIGQIANGKLKPAKLSLDKLAMVLSFVRAKAAAQPTVTSCTTPAAGGAGELPPLPGQAFWGLNMHGSIVIGCNNHEKQIGMSPGASEPMFTADQMHAYARAALSAASTAPAEPSNARHLHQSWYAAPSDAGKVLELPEDDVPVIALGFGRIEVGEGTANDRPALMFLAREDYAPIGEPLTTAPRELEPNEGLAVVTFENVAAVDVVLAKLEIIRTRLEASRPAAEAQGEAVACAKPFFTHDPEDGTSFFATQAEALEYLRAGLEYARNEANFDGEWSCEMDSYRVGVVTHVLAPVNDDGESCDYRLMPVAASPSSAAAQAEPTTGGARDER